MISEDPDLSQFYALFKSTGGNSGIPGPPFEERFNRAETLVRYTVFAPINSAFANLNPELIKTLTSPPAYPFLASILKTHLTEGELSSINLTNGGTFTAVEGFKINVSAAESQTGISINGQARLISSIPVQASNGAVFKIDGIVDPYADYFGRDSSSPHPAESNTSMPVCDGDVANQTSMADVLNSTPQVSTFMRWLGAVAPEFVTTLDSIPKAEGDANETVLFAPSNTAFANLPSTAVDKALEPHNQPLTAWLLKNQFVRMSGRANTISMFGLPLATTMAPNGNVSVINNANVEREKVCSCNGCVYVVSKWIDPLFGILGLQK
ncbi:FAS1 domain-containing protein [Pseudomassariella vexata]|uniref:FAS1 domain-containing protein n=1 Tax=Pseudomassariella vexata TaxID=1141098 RepID=A0A1Y2DQY1_9PEZI|nr:FAS1 domain-containing protein [Pseudomassariella vexata]ORY61627.1 FAS1 domain-containing protein [Pseudomassariella vexata]